MSGYLQRLFNRAAAAPAPALPVASPANRIGSPIAERDQRLNLPEFGDAVITADVWPETPGPAEPVEPPTPAPSTVIRNVHETRIVDLFPRAVPTEPQPQAEAPRPAAEPAIESVSFMEASEPPLRHAPQPGAQTEPAPLRQRVADENGATEPARTAPVAEPAFVPDAAEPRLRPVARAEPVPLAPDHAAEFADRARETPRIPMPAPEPDVGAPYRRGEPAIVPEPDRIIARPVAVPAERTRPEPEPVRAPAPDPQAAGAPARAEPRHERTGATSHAQQETQREERKVQSPPAPRPLTAEAASIIGPLPVRRRTPAIFGMRRR